MDTMRPEPDAVADKAEVETGAGGGKMADRAIGVFVHESELLKMDFLVSHPVVKVRQDITRTKTGTLHSFPCKWISTYFYADPGSRS